ncbi:MAG: endonuclease/exonuclease/phosphatase family protein [Lentisphaerae bacterium]|nr:endonuclease/exonuclease/phosphatase family protein [Lentisphaerota bacterium]
MRLLVYNIAYGTGSPRNTLQLLAGAARYVRTPERYFRAITHLVRHFRPDVAGFLETDNGSFRTGGTSQVAVLSDLLQSSGNGGFYTKYAPQSYLAKLPYCRHQTNALLVRNAVAGREWRDFMPCGAKRLILGREYNGVEILLVHLALTAAVRRKQLDYLAQLVQPGKKMIICGDFNTFGGYRELLHFLRKTKLKSANKIHQATYPARNPTKELDYILYSPQLELKNFQIKRFPGSDHLPLLADFAINDAT